MRLSGSIAIAFLLLCGTACGDDPVRQRADAGPDSDAPPPDPNLVTLTVVSGGQAIAGALVVFHNSDGSVIETGVSGGGGSAALAMPEGGMVTVSVGATPLKTFTKVLPGDSMTLDISPGSAPIGNASISLEGSIATANAFRVSTGCGAITIASAAEPAMIPVTSGCLSGDGQMAAIALALENDAGGALLAIHGIAGARDVPVNGDVSFTLPAFAPITETVTLNLSGTQTLLSASVGEVVDGVVFSRTVLVPGSVPPAIPVQRDIADALHYSIAFRRPALTIPGGTLARAHFDFNRAAKTETSLSYDTDADGLEAITSVSLDAADLNRPSVSFVSAASTADLWQATINWTSVGTSEIQAWDLIAPAADTTVTFPELPMSLADRWNPTNAVDIGVGTILIEHSELATYDDARTGPGFSLFTSKPPIADVGGRLRAVVGVYAQDAPL